MAHARVVMELDIPADEAWRRLWQLPRHSAAVPLTEVSGPEALGPGSHFVATTVLGPLRLDDRMVVRAWEPPAGGRNGTTGRAVVQKLGPVLTGSITATVSARDGGGSRLLWEQQFGARGVPDLLVRPAAPLVRWGYARSLRRILA